ncbi:putative F-box protein [Panicum miliaceum]|uniref:F-box protein n=1 Tax=Panicum miliaceum TaxID=4540 RepID=A0A3L6QQM6_PANMI|nr:putative F-box protein [Panicum miliaceum]
MPYLDAASGGTAAAGTSEGESRSPEMRRLAPATSSAGAMLSRSRGRLCGDPGRLEAASSADPEDAGEDDPRVGGKMPEKSLTSCKVPAKSPAPLPLLQPLLCVGFKGGRISQKVCSSPSFLCWAPSSSSSLLLAPATLGAPPSPHTHPNPHSAPCSHLSLSDLISESMLVISLPEVMTVSSSAHARLFYGQLICGGGRNCVVVDVFTGARVLPPQNPFSEDTYFYSGMLTAPLTSHNAHLLVCAAPEQGSTQRTLLDWPVGSDSWSELRLNDSRIEQIVEFKVWVEVEKLENHVLFIGSDERSPAFSCVSLGRWGRRNNCLYYAYYDVPWILHGLGDEADAVWDPDNVPDIVFKRNWYTQLQPFWVYPSMFYADADGE